MIEWDIEELAYRAMGKTNEETESEINDGDIEQAVFDKYEIGFDTYCAIVKDLLPFTKKLKGALTGGCFYAFVDNDEHRAIVKLEVISSL